MAGVMAKWRVIGPRPVLGHKPGETFLAELAPEVAERAMARGSIELVDDKPTRLDPSSVSAPKKRKSDSEPSDEESAEPSSELAPESESEGQ